MSISNVSKYDYIVSAGIIAALIALTVYWWRSGVLWIPPNGNGESGELRGQKRD